MASGEAHSRDAQGRIELPRLIRESLSPAIVCPLL